MFLFNKKTRNTIKFIWAILAFLVVLSMIITYSGFTTLARTKKQEQQIEVPLEVQAQLEAQKNGLPAEQGEMTPEKEQILKTINEGKIDINPSDGETPTPQENSETQTPTTPPQTLELKI